MKKWIVMMLCAAFVLVSVNAEPADSAAAEKNEAAAEQAEAKTAQQATAVKDGESKEKKEDLDELEKARQALQYGLESEILEVTGKIDKQDFETLQEDFNRLFADTKSPAVREGLFGLYQKYDNPYLTQAAEAVLEDYPRQQRTVIKASLSYLAAVKPELNTALSDAVKSLITEETADYGAEAVAVLGEIGGDDEAAFLAGKSFCFTGELHTMKRAEAESRVKERGGSVKSSVGKGLSYLVTNTPDSGSSKNKKAQELGTAIITEQEFLKLLHSSEL